MSPDKIRYRLHPVFLLVFLSHASMQTSLNDVEVFNMDANTDILLSSIEAAQARGITEQRCRQERCRGEGPAFLRDSKTGNIWYPWSELVGWAEHHNRRLRWPGERQ